MANCCNCSAPLPANSLTCDYCGSRNDIDLTGIHYHTTHQLDSPRTCPRCDITLTTIDLRLDGKFLIERCEQCHGLFFDPGEVEALLEAKVTNVFTVNTAQIDLLNSDRRTPDYGISYLKCPCCAQMMSRANYGAKSGVIVDRCREHGVWLDAGELRHLFEWMKAGGKLLDQERRQQQAKQEMVEQERRRSELRSTPGPCHCDDTFDHYGGTFRGDERDVFDLVYCAVKYFLR